MKLIQTVTQVCRCTIIAGIISLSCCSSLSVVVQKFGELGPQQIRGFNLVLEQVKEQLKKRRNDTYNFVICFLTSNRT